MFEIGDTICNVYDCTKIGECKGFVLKCNDTFVEYIQSNIKLCLNTYKAHYKLSKMVLIEKTFRWPR